MSIAGLVALSLATGARYGTADENVATAALSESRAVFSGQKTESTSNAKRQLGLVGSRLERTRAIRINGHNLHASTLAMRFSGSSAEDSATFETRSLVAPEKARHTRRTAVWFSGNVTLGSARAENPRLATIHTDGLAFGVDARLGRRLLLGNAVGLAFDRTGVGNEGSLKAHYFSNTLYGSLTTSSDTYLDLAVGASRGIFSRFGGSGPSAADNRQATQTFALTRFSRVFRHDWLRVRSYGQAHYMRTRFDACGRDGRDIYFAPYSAQSLDLTLGLRGETSVLTRIGKVSPHAVLEISRALKATSATAITSLGGIEDVTAPSTNRSGRLYARTGLKWAISERAAIDGEYTLSSAMDDFDARQKVTARFKLKF